LVDPDAGRDAVVVVQNDFQPATERDAVDGGHYGLAQHLESPQHLLEFVEVGGDLGGRNRVLRLRSPSLHVPEVTTGKECSLCRGEHDADETVLLGFESVDCRGH